MWSRPNGHALTRIAGSRRSVICRSTVQNGGQIEAILAPRPQRDLRGKPHRQRMDAVLRRGRQVRHEPDRSALQDACGDRHDASPRRDRAAIGLDRNACPGPSHRITDALVPSRTSAPLPERRDDQGA